MVRAHIVSSFVDPNYSGETSDFELITNLALLITSNYSLTQLWYDERCKDTTLIY